MAAPPSDHPTRTLPPVEPANPVSKRVELPNDHTATHGPPPDANFTKSFEGPDSPTSFPTPDDRYMLVSFLAQGGMGEVWIAKDRVLNREVALKLLREELLGKKYSSSRFIEEARITGKLAHPGIPPLHDLGTLRDGRPFIAMKLIKGRTLADLLANERPPLPELLRIFEDVCNAVASAHDARVIHRDLKPGNIMVGRFDEVQVMDWGLAKVLGAPSIPSDSKPPDDATQPPVSIIESDRDPSSHTKAGSLLGTPAYMPPEQAKGEIDRTDTRSDVFALGAMLCEFLTCRPPYWAATAAEIQAMAVIGQTGPGLERLNACGADPELIQLAKQCLHLNPDERPADAKQVSTAVKTYRDGVEERLRRAERERIAAEAKATEEVNTRREAEKRRRFQLALVAAAGLLIVAVGGGLWWADHQAAAKQAAVDRVEAQRRAEADQRAARNGQVIEGLLVEVDAALKADDAAKAAIPFDLIEKRAAEGGAEPLADRIARARTDLAMLRALDAADDLLWTAEDYTLRTRRSSEAWAAAFKSYGVEVAASPDAAVKRINESLLRERLLLALDLWWLNHPGKRPAEFRKLLATADPDRYRNDYRAAIGRGEVGQLMPLMDVPEAFRQPPRFAAVIGQTQRANATSREKVLRPALERHPDDFALILTMVAILESQPEFRLETAAQQLRWSQAAVSVRPNSKVAWRYLGKAYWDRGQIDDAVRCYKKAVRLDANDANSWTQLSTVLLRQHDPDAALEAADRALAVNPNFATAHASRGSVLDRLGRRDEALQAFNAAIELHQKDGFENSSLLNNRGYTRLALGDVNGAIADFQNAVRISPDFRVAETNLNFARELRRTGPVREEAPPPREAGK